MAFTPIHVISTWLLQNTVIAMLKEHGETLNETRAMLAGSQAKVTFSVGKLLSLLYILYYITHIKAMRDPILQNILGQNIIIRIQI
jgi:hypothetical protein